MDLRPQSASSANPSLGVLDAGGAVAASGGSIAARTDGDRAAHRAARTDAARHVLLVIDQLCELGGAERVLLEIARRLPQDRFPCSVVTFQVNPQLDALKSLGRPLHVLPLRRTYDLQAARVALQLRDLIRRENVSIVHSFFETSDIWAAPIAKWSGCPVLVSSRRDMGILRGRKHELAYPVVNKLFDRVLAVSDEVRAHCLKHDRLRPERVETLYNGIDLAELSARAFEHDARERLRLPPNVPVISTVANIRPVKGLDVLVRAAARVRSEFPDAVFLIAGSVLVPETFAELEALVASLGLQNNVRFLGKTANPYPLLRASDLFCLPSRSEGFSNALIEAMACGLPCVATQVGGNGEAIADGVNGFLVPSEDSNALADRILRLLRDPHRRGEMGRAARGTVESRFSMGAMMSRLMNIYDELLVTKHV